MDFYTNITETIGSTPLIRLNSVAQRLVEETPNAFLANPYHNPVNPQSHYDFTGPEIWQQTDGRITHFIAGIGTGGTITGVGHNLKEKNPDIKIIGIDPNVPVVEPNTTLNILMNIFSESSVVIIQEDKQVQGILTKIDILDFLSRQGD